jgi:hypothetical protein
MKISTALLSAVLAAGLLAAGVTLAPSFADDRRLPAAETPWLPLPKLLERLAADGYRDIEKIERERGRYEVRATDRQGARVKLYLHPHSGEVIDRGQERRWRERDGSASDSDRRRRDGSADCTKRRCRDDLPATGTTPPPAVR